MRDNNPSQALPELTHAMVCSHCYISSACVCPAAAIGFTLPDESVLRKLGVSRVPSGKEITLCLALLKQEACREQLLGQPRPGVRQALTQDYLPPFQLGLLHGRQHTMLKH